jgi:hypothetical protein
MRRVLIPSARTSPDMSDEISNNPDPFTDIACILNDPNTVPQVPGTVFQLPAPTPDNPNPVVEVRLDLLKRILEQDQLLVQGLALLAQEITALKEWQQRQDMLPAPPTNPVVPRKRFMRVGHDTPCEFYHEHSIGDLAPAASLAGRDIYMHVAPDVAT